MTGTGEFTYDGAAHYPQYTNNDFGDSDDFYFQIRLPSTIQINAGEYTETFYLKITGDDGGASVFFQPIHYDGHKEIRRFR